MLDWPACVGNEIPVYEIDIIVRNAAAAPCPGRTAQGSANREVHGSMSPRVNNLSLRCLGDLAVEELVSAFQKENFSAKVFQLQSERHAHRAGTDDANGG